MPPFATASLPPMRCRPGERHVYAAAADVARWLLPRRFSRASAAICRPPSAAAVVAAAFALRFAMAAQAHCHVVGDMPPFARCLPAMLPVVADVIISPVAMPPSRRCLRYALRFCLLLIATASAR